MSPRATRVQAPEPAAPKPRATRSPKAKAAAKARAQAKLVLEGQRRTAREIEKLEKNNASTKASRARKPAERLGHEQHVEKMRAASKAKPRTTGAVARNEITAHKLRLMATTGMTPLEFLTAVYRDQLYKEYDTEIVDEKRGLAQFFPKMDPATGALATEKVPLKIEQRIAAATSAAPYVHRKKPIGIDGGEGKPLTVLTADKLASLSNAELDNLLQVFGKLGVGAEFEGGAQRPYGIEDEDNQ
jgi:hypothetical protein